MAVNRIGVGVAQGIWSAMIIVVSFLWGVLLFDEHLKSIPLAILAVGLLLFGTVGMAISPIIFQPQKMNDKDNENPKNINQSTDSLPNHLHASNIKPQGVLDSNIESKPLLSNAQEKQVSWFNSRISGYVCAILCGIWGGSMNTPIIIASKLAHTSGLGYVFSFGMGAAIVDTFFYLMYTICCLTCLDKPVPRPQIKVMFIPGAISGLLWSIGNYLQIFAILLLGESIANPSIQISLLVAGLWGIFYYKELSGRQIAVWTISASVAVAGVALLSQQ